MNVAMYRMTSALEHGDSDLAVRTSTREAVTGLLPQVRCNTAAGRELHEIAYRMGLNA